MKKLTIASLIIFNIAASSAAFAQESTQVAPASTPKKLVLPLDHGPHAQVTQWTNEQTRLRAAAADAKLAGQDSAAPSTTK